jgi:hypothetical protein
LVAVEPLELGSTGSDVDDVSLVEPPLVGPLELAEVDGSGVLAVAVDVAVVVVAAGGPAVVWLWLVEAGWAGDVVAAGAVVRFAVVHGELVGVAEVTVVASTDDDPDGGDEAASRAPTLPPTGGSPLPGPAWVAASVGGVVDDPGTTAQAMTAQSTMATPPASAASRRWVRGLG